MSVTVTFDVEDDADRAFLGKYVRGDVAEMRRQCVAGNVNLTGRARGNPRFVPVRAATRAADARPLYESMATEFELPSWKGLPKALEALTAWESANDDLLTELWEPAPFKGATGTGQLARRCRFAMVPAGNDPSGEAQDARGTLLRQILDRAAPSDPAKFEEGLDGLRERARDDLAKLWREEKGAAIGSVEAALQTRLSRYVPGLDLGLAPGERSVKIEDPSLDLWIDDAGHQSAPGQHGHGLQRALSLALVEELAELGKTAGGNDDAPTMVLAIEEPELYQHPARARHLATVIQELSANRVQVIYATHSPTFVQAAHFEKVRCISKSKSDGSVTVRSAEMEKVIEHLPSEKSGADIRVEMRLNGGLSEAFFAKAVVLVEGTSDEGVFAGLAVRGGFSLDAGGLALISCHGKTGIAPAVAVLRELDIPFVLVFDADSQSAARSRKKLEFKSRQAGEPATEEQLQEAESAKSAQEARLNREILVACGLTPTDFPSGPVGDRVFALPDHLEALLDSEWPEHGQFRRHRGEQRGKAFAKSRTGYEEAAADADGTVPELLASVMAAVKTLRDV